MENNKWQKHKIKQEHENGKNPEYDNEQTQENTIVLSW